MEHTSLSPVRETTGAISPAISQSIFNCRRIRVRLQNQSWPGDTVRPVSLDITKSGLLEGKYEVVRRLAHGGMGEVHLVRHLHLDELRVLKVLRADLVSNEVAKQRFQREARTAISVKHPNLATLYDYAQFPDGRFYMVWEYIEGPDINIWLENNGVFPPEHAIEVTIQALRGLDAIHSSGVIHRDISPDNILISKDRRGHTQVKIIDLGLAKNLGSSLEVTQAGTFLGKFQYCSPEQAGYRKEDGLDHRSDLYSLGLVLYEMLVGKQPFESETPHGFVLQRINGEPISIVGRRPEVTTHPILAQVVMKAIQRDREDRHQDAIDFIEALVDAGNKLGRLDNRQPKAPPKPTGPKQKVIASQRTLTQEERVEILGIIEQSGSRGPKFTTIAKRAEDALKEGHFEDAKKHLLELAAKAPAHPRVRVLKKRIDEAEAIARRRSQVLQAEQMLEKYLLGRQKTLAALAMEALFDLYPNHPKRADYESWVKLLDQEIEDRKRSEILYKKGMDAVVVDDFDLARLHLTELESTEVGGHFAGRLLSEIKATEAANKSSSAVGDRKKEIEDLLNVGNIKAAEKAYLKLTKMDTARVTLNLLQGRIDAEKSRKAQISKVDELESAFFGSLDRKDFSTARKLMSEIEDNLEDRDRVRILREELAEKEGSLQRHQALTDGLKHFYAYLKAEKMPEAKLALKILVQIGPDHPDVLEAKKQFEATEQA